MCVCVCVCICISVSYLHILPKLYLLRGSRTNCTPSVRINMCPDLSFCPSTFLSYTHMVYSPPSFKYFLICLSVKLKLIYSM